MTRLRFSGTGPPCRERRGVMRVASYIGLTLTALGPLVPAWVLNETFAPSARAR